MKDSNPGDMSVRIGFARVFGGGPEQGQLRPSIQITDGTSGLTLELNLTAADIAELISGSEVRVTANDVTGFGGVQQWGKYRKHKTLRVETAPGDYKLKDRDGAAIRALPHVAPLVAELEADGFRVDTPTRDNSGHWRVTGRRYDEQP